MAKVNEVVVDALEDLVTQAEEAPIEAPEARSAIRVLNDMMTMWAALGVNLGYTVVEDLGDLMTVPAGAIFGIKAHLAGSLCDKYDIAITPTLQRKMDLGWRAILNLAITPASSEYPSTLPQGSGNNFPSYRDSTFYPDRQSTILTETGGSIALEDDTEEAS